MIRSVLPGSIAVAVSIAVAGPSAGESLTDAFISAYRNSALLESTRALLRAEDESVAAAVAALRPTLVSAASITGRMERSPAGQNVSRRTNDGRVRTALSLTAEWLLSDGGAGEFGTKAARETVLAARHTLVEVEQSVLMSAAIAFHDVILRNELLELAENGLRVFESQLEAAQGRFELGEVTRTDVSIVEARLASAKSELLLRRGELEIARESYRLATGTYPDGLLPPPPAPEIPISLESARNIARSHHPSILRAQHTVAAAQHAVRQAEIIRPLIYLGGTVAANRDVGAWERGNDSASVSLTARMPLYYGGQFDSRLRRGIANLERARFELEQTTRVVDQEVAAAWTRLQIAKSSIEARELQVAATELALTGLKQEAGLGLRTTLDVIDSELDVLAAGNDLIAAKNDRNVAVYSLLASVGLMTVKHLGLGIPVYDPAKNLNRVQSAPVETWPMTSVDRAFRALGVE